MKRYNLPLIAIVLSLVVCVLPEKAAAQEDLWVNGCWFTESTQLPETEDLYFFELEDGRYLTELVTGLRQTTNNLSVIDTDFGRSFVYSSTLRYGYTMWVHKLHPACNEISIPELAHGLVQFRGVPTFYPVLAPEPGGELISYVSPTAEFPDVLHPEQKACQVVSQNNHWGMKPGRIIPKPPEGGWWVLTQELESGMGIIGNYRARVKEYPYIKASRHWNRTWHQVYNCHEHGLMAVRFRFRWVDFIQGKWEWNPVTRADFELALPYIYINNISP